MNLNVEQWKLFDFNKVFIIKKGFYNKKPDTSGTGNIPFLGATDNNNGVTQYNTLSEIDTSSRTGLQPNETLDKKIFPPNAVCVTNNGSVGHAYFQNKQFTCSHDVNPLYRRNGEFNVFTGLFISTIIMLDKYRWGYGRKWRPERMQKSQLKLPILRDETGIPIIDAEKKYSDDGYIPDWKFMEDYIKTLNHKPISTKNSMNANPINTSEWKEYKVKNLFDVKGTKTTKIEELENYGKGNYPYVTTQAVNNGVANKYNYYTESGGVLTIDSAVLGYCTYQEKPFSASDHVEKLTPKFKMNKYIALFFVALFNNECYKYSYGRKANQLKIKETILKLPTKNNEPDWQFMEDYIKSLAYADRI